MIKTHYRTIVRAAFLVTAVFFTQTAIATLAETIFKKAEHYTVKIEVSIEKPFIWDSKSSASATGFVVDLKRGWILTNAHVAGRSPAQIVISFKGGEQFKARTVYVDPLLDIAVLQAPLDKIHKGTLQAKMDCQNIAQSGQPVGAYGHPYGLSYTATRGIVSGTNIIGGNERLQTDAPINSGNSGGPLISLQSGKVVGINTAKVKAKGVDGLNFAIASPYACRIIDLLKAGKDPSPVIMPAIFLEEDEPLPPVVAMIPGNTTNSPLKEGDIVISVNGSKTAISSIDRLQHEMRGLGPKVTWRVKRNNRLMDIKLEVKRMPRVDQQVGVYVSGLLISKNIVRKDEQNGKGTPLMVHYAGRGTAATLQQFREFDYIVAIDGKRYSSSKDLYRYLKSIKKGNAVTIKVKRYAQNYRRTYDYYEMKLPVKDLEWLDFKSGA
ncbi:MAG: trypsin-like peptidase domain-containing protein [Acidiferrobacterales bacterium]